MSVSCIEFLVNCLACACSNVLGNASELKLGDEVEFALNRRASRVSADNICKLAKGTIEAEARELTSDTTQFQKTRSIDIE